jgi:asparagine synthase (glutamine-hydrolysing)
MCGIWAYLSNKELNQLRINYFEAFMKLKSRGPDYSRLEIINHHKIILGFHRLAIMDPSVKGNQPFIVETEDNVIYSVCNGEIYNYKELIAKFNLYPLSDSDCEIIPLLYTRVGMNCLLEELNGEFAFILVDYNKNSKQINVFVARDRFGIRPLFYSITKDGINLSSELKGLTSCCEETTDDIVNIFPPRHFMHIKYDDNWKINSLNNYYRIDNIPIIFENKDIDKAKKLINEVFRQAVIDRLESDRPLGCLLSGGLDSSLVASIASSELKKKGRRLRTFSIGMEGSTDEYYARKVAEFIDSDHTHILIDKQVWIDNLVNVIKTIESYDITSVRASTGQYLISKWISENTDIKVLLIGDGSDELCAGYMYFHNSPSHTDTHNENIRLLEDIHMYDVLRADRGIADNGLEARVPFLDYRFVNLYLSINPELRTPNNKTGKIEKWLLRESFNDMKTLPLEVLFRKKEAFSDGVSSVEKSWYKIIQEHADTLWTDDEFKIAISEIDHNKPPSKEALYFRKIFETLFTKNKTIAQTIPYFWLPKWSGIVNEPSARILNVY